MSIAEEFARRFREEHDVHAQYLDGMLELGDFGRLEDGVFKRLGSFEWVAGFGEQPPTAKTSYSLQVGSVSMTQIEASGAGRADPALEVKAAAKFTFGRGFSALMILSGVTVRRVDRILALEQELLRRQRLPESDPDHFDPALCVVTEVSNADAYWLYAARERDATITLEALADAPPFDLGAIGGGFTLKSQSGAVTATKGAKPSTRLFRLTGLSRSLPFTRYRAGFLSDTGGAPVAAGVQPTATARTGSVADIHVAASAPRFDHLYVVSDLHVGGAEKMHPYTDDAAMGWLGAELARRAATERVCWVIAGDILDFLAYPDPPGTYFDPDNALNRLEQIADENGETFKAWGTFAAAEGATLVFMLGNHDLELGMPKVWGRFCELIRDKSGASETILKKPWAQRPPSGSDFRCFVGLQSICVKHGNEADAWNVVDYGRLAAFAKEETKPLWRGWRPNDGTALVVDQMNKLKPTYPFVDLLKPEDDAVATMLLPFVPLDAETIGNAWRSGRLQSRVETMKERTGLVGEEELPLRGGPIRRAPPVSGDELVGQAVRFLEEGNDPLDLQQGGNELGVRDALNYFAHRLWDSPEDAAYEAVQKNLGSNAFHPLVPDKWSDWFASRFPPYTNLLIVGHTHLAKLLKLTSQALYVNSGTWMPLIDLPTILTQGRTKFRQLFEAVGEKSLAALDEKKLLIRRRTVVHVAPTGVELLSVQRVGDAEMGPIETVDDPAELELRVAASINYGGGT